MVMADFDAEVRTELMKESFTEELLRAMEEVGMTRADLARATGKSRGFITQVLAGHRNVTVRTMADLAFGVGCRARVLLDREET